MCNCEQLWAPNQGHYEQMTIKLNDWVQHTRFGIGQVSALRGDKLDIAFVDTGDKTLLVSAPLQHATFPTAAEGAAIAKRRKSRSLAKNKAATK